jgi:hypothetical protein
VVAGCLSPGSGDRRRGFVHEKVDARGLCFTNNWQGIAVIAFLRFATQVDRAGAVSEHLIPLLDLAHLPCLLPQSPLTAKTSDATKEMERQVEVRVNDVSTRYSCDTARLPYGTIWGLREFATDLWILEAAGHVALSKVSRKIVRRWLV